MSTLRSPAGQPPVSTENESGAGFSPAAFMQPATRMKIEVRMMASKMECMTGQRLKGTMLLSMDNPSIEKQGIGCRNRKTDLHPREPRLPQAAEEHAGMTIAILFLERILPDTLGRRFAG
jgi:hypothetical protein